MDDGAKSALPGHSPGEHRDTDLLPRDVTAVIGTFGQEPPRMLEIIPERSTSAPSLDRAMIPMMPEPNHAPTAPRELLRIGTGARLQ